MTQEEEFCKELRWLRSSCAGAMNGTMPAKAEPEAQAALQDKRAIPCVQPISEQPDGDALDDYLITDLLGVIRPTSPASTPSAVLPEAANVATQPKQLERDSDQTKVTEEADKKASAGTFRSTSKMDGPAILCA